MKLDELSIRAFVDELSSAKATPGGGSVAALCGALGAALSTMVAELAAGKEKFKERWTSMEEIKSSTDLLRTHFLTLIQKDADAYQEVVVALRLPRETEQQRISRREAVQASLKKAAKVPLETLRASEGLMEIAQKAVEHGDPNAITDAGAAVNLAYIAGQIAAYNVRINLSQIEDEGFRQECSREVEERTKKLAAVLNKMDEYLNTQLKRGEGEREKGGSGKR